jgi:preprotein translocase subunit SecE
MNKIASYFAGAQQEFKLIKWPTAKETRTLTLVVIGVSLFLAVFLGVFDYIFTYGITQLIQL